MRIQQYPVKRGRVEIIPMIDVVFFLLVFSMLGSLALASINAPKVDVPNAANAASGSPARCFVTLTRDKKLYVNEKQVGSTPEVTQALKSELARNPALFVIINCDKANSWGEFRALMAAAYNANPRSLAIRTR
jgi:biopolymer transport protein ExbD